MSERRKEVFGIIGRRYGRMAEAEKIVKEMLAKGETVHVFDPYGNHKQSPTPLDDLMYFHKQREEGNLSLSTIKKILE